MSIIRAQLPCLPFAERSPKVESKGDLAMATKGKHKTTIRALYESAMNEVRANPAAALAKYQPTWLISLPQQRPGGGCEHAPRRGKRHS